MKKSFWGSKASRGSMKRVFGPKASRRSMKKGFWVLNFYMTIILPDSNIFLCLCFLVVLEMEMDDGFDTFQPERYRHILIWRMDGI